MDTPIEQLESEDAKESNLEFDAKKFTDVFKVVTILALMIGGYRAKNITE